MSSNSNLSTVLKTLKGLELTVSTERTASIKGVALAVTDDGFLILQIRSNEQEEIRKVVCVKDIIDLTFTIKKEQKPTIVEEETQGLTMVNATLVGIEAGIKSTKSEKTSKNKNK